MDQTPEQVPLSQRLWNPLWQQARHRPARLGPGRIAVPLRILAVLTWLGSVIMLAFGFIPGLFESKNGSLYGGELVFLYSPFWPLLGGLAIGSGAAAAGYVVTATGPDAPRHHAALAWCAGVWVPLIPVLMLAIGRDWQTIPAAVAWLAGAEVVIGCLHVRRRAPRPWVGLVLACLVAAPWIPAIHANLRFGLALNAAKPPPDGELLEMFIADVSTRTYVPGIALAFVGAMATAGVALAAHSRSAVAQQISAHRGGWRLTAIICAVAVGVIVLEVSGVAGVSSGFIEDYWGLGHPWTWPHAVLVAVAIAYVTQRSFRTPLVQRGDVAATLAIGVSALAVHILIAIVLIVNLVADAITGPRADSISPPEGLVLLIAWLGLAALVPIALRERWDGTVGQAVARVGLLFLVPVYIGVLGDQLGYHWPVTFWAKAPQVAICLTIIGCVATIFGLLGRPTPISSEMTNRLVLIPLLIVSGASWLPNVIAVPLTPVIAVTAALFALLWALPAVDRDEEHAGSVLTVSAQLLLVAAASAIVSCLPDISAGDPTLAMLLFGVPLSVLLCAKVTQASRLQPVDGRGDLVDVLPTPK
ncbi:hypothetical protein [Mycolicibacterium lutetiense]|uniref:Integral membrane protein n=1 Tax=Mycolicibacterium lutetiense TaxID=1641992 RepID=A0ABS4ZM41_9MYCO|nr:hypothetical protein [Mycolicibacterium lutetiense]MBP2450557.1 hypothetical protein [Mycolicibacterium lutetiense]